MRKIEYAGLAEGKTPDTNHPLVILTDAQDCESIIQRTYESWRKALGIAPDDKVRVTFMVVAK